jgi:hypothetical protein
MKSNGLLVKVRGGSKKAFQALSKSLGPNAVEPILTLPPSGGSLRTPGMHSGQSATWFRVRDHGADNPWDAAHRLVQQMQAGGPLGVTASGGVEFIEPDIEQSWFGDAEMPDGALALAKSCTFHPQDKSGGKAASSDGNAWNLGAAYSQLAAAREEIDPDLLAKVIVAHLDTGFDPNHATRPANLDLANQRNFCDPDLPNDATDRTPDGLPAIRNQGHGTATLALLAGNRLEGAWPGFADYIGGAPFVSVVPIRMADWVVRFSTGTMVQGLQHAINLGAHVLSMSMGGLTSRALADAVNLAYESGVFMVTAAGNNYAKLPTPKTIVFPARYRRVLAACGVMSDGRAYAGLKFRTMQGNYGPQSKMATALGAYTPNVPWAEFGCGNLVSMDGAGTSAATPQIAAAAALWFAKHRAELAKYPEPWMRVQAARFALFESALKKTSVMNEEETFSKVGQGVMQAARALAIQPPDDQSLSMASQAEPSWGWLNLIFGGGVSLQAGMPPQWTDMLSLELTQMAQRVRAVESAISDCDADAGDVSPVTLSKYLEAALDAGSPSGPLRAFLEQHLGRTQVAVGPGPAAVVTRSVRRKPKVLPSPPRRLRVYALDPSVAKSLESVAVNETVLSIPWEENLAPGPVGEYLEVVDVDPASNRLYDPVNLNEPKLLAQDGWAPSEGNPEFHQQMVYAVAMRTIGNFEEALGRKVLWAPRWGTVTQDGKTTPKAYEVPRLRIYPHALRTDNAYYSPDKAALLFGYFLASSSPDDSTPNGSMVFSCLSSDIIAHEMSHALLDGMHRKFQEASNPDVPAFHEGFADIVAIFQHFAIPELVRFQIARARGRLDAAKLLGSLAQQFGEGTARGGPLRDYLGDEIGALSYAKTMEVHARGSILVSAVYQAFLSIVDNRTADLIRIATNGTGVLPDGALHPDLVNRLTEEACKTARHVLRICIRALDYCPAVDITFGEYLRAIITADLDLVANDSHHYRLAFMEAFRRRDLLPRDVRTVSEETLAWETLEDSSPGWLGPLVKDLEFGWDRVLDRSKVFQLNESNRWRFFMAMRKLLAQREELHSQFGLLPGVPRYSVTGDVVKEADPGKTTFDVPSIRPSRRVAPDGSFHVEVVATVLQRRRVPINPKDPNGPQMWFRGGATLILDPRPGRCEVRYAIVKNSGSVSRLERQRRMATSSAASPLRALYLDDSRSEPFALLHSGHRGC